MNMVYVLVEEFLHPFPYSYTNSFHWIETNWSHSAVFSVVQYSMYFDLMYLWIFIYVEHPVVIAVKTAVQGPYLQLHKLKHLLY